MSRDASLALHFAVWDNNLDDLEHLLIENSIRA